MSSNRIYDLARKLNVPSRELLEMLKKQGIDARSHMSTVDDTTAALILETFGAKARPDGNRREGSPSQEKKKGDRTYIPPRTRHRRKPVRPKSTEGEGLRSENASERRVVTSTERHGETKPFQTNEGQSAKENTRKLENPRRREHRPNQKPAAPHQSKQQGREQLHKKTDERSVSDRTTRKEGTAQYPRKKKGPEQAKRREQVAAKPGESAQRLTKGAPKTSLVEVPGKRKEGTPATQRRTVPRFGRRQQTRRVKKKTTTTPKMSPSSPIESIPEIPKCLEIPEIIMVKDLAEMMKMPSAKIVHHLMTMGIMANVNQGLSTKAAKSIAEEFGFEAIAVTVEEKAEKQEETIDRSRLKTRPPVVTIMGHVDHGKTTLLDAIRESKITDSEFGGITQHIGAYVVKINEQKIVFLDTPGHEAFTAMRARGAKVTDEVILVVAADDGIMPQTIEAIDHARDANVPIMVAINKIDVPGANPDRVMQELAKYGLTPEEWGGETICVKVSAKMRTNLDEILEMIVLQAEMLELKADPDRPAKGIVVEALLDKGRGPVATVLIQSGTLRIGDPFVVGMHYGKVRAMLDDRGKRVSEVGPSTPVEVLGLTGVPVAGDSFVVVDGEREARQIAESRQDQQQALEFSKTSKITLEELHQHIKDGHTQELRIVIKADVHGSVEALSDALERLSTEKVKLQVIHGGVGAVNESDVMLAAASNAIVLGFNVRPVVKARELAEKEQIDVRLYNVIYKAIDDVKKAMEGLLEPVYNEVLIGQAQVLALFSLPKGGMVAGCRVTNGKITRNSIARVVRDKKECFKGNLASLRRVKDDVKEVLTGYECGIRLENYNDIRENDIIEAYTLEKMSMSLDGTVTKKD